MGRAIEPIGRAAGNADADADADEEDDDDADKDEDAADAGFPDDDDAADCGRAFVVALECADALTAAAETGRVAACLDAAAVNETAAFAFDTATRAPALDANDATALPGRFDGTLA